MNERANMSETYGQPDGYPWHSLLLASIVGEVPG
jgi:hypothetical protein